MLEMAESTNVAGVTAKQLPRKRRARLTPQEHRQIVGLYGGPHVSNAEIRQRFAITDTSLYRLLQKHGTPLLGRGTSHTSGAGNRLRRNRARAGTAGRGRARKATSVIASPDGQATQEFRIEFPADRIVVADSVHDAFQQAMRARATEVTAIVRQ
jgi:transposase-like protein